MKNQERLSKRKNNYFLRYLPLASQMLMIIILGVFLGNYIDEKYNGDGLWLALISVFSVIVAIYLGIKDLLKK